MPVLKGGIGIHGGEVEQRITALVGGGSSVQDGNSGGGNSGSQPATGGNKIASAKNKPL
jgi:hypothetical protein